MKQRLLPILLMAAACLLTGCQNQPSAQESTAAPEQQISYEGIPVISIQTVSDDKNALDFVRKPVARHVSRQIASWTPHYIMPPEPYYETCTISVTDQAENILLSPAEAEVKVRGNWTTTYDKKPLRIKFAEKQNLLGLNDGAEMRNWLLLACYKDGSMLRDKSALQMARELLGADGLYAADAAFAEVQINGQYWGVYLLTEMQQVNSHRIDITEPEKDYTGTDIGYFLEFDGYFYNEDALHQFHVDYADNAPLTPFDGEGGGRTITCLPKAGSRVKDVGFSVKSDIYSQEQHDFIASYVNNVYRILYAAAYENKALVFNADYTETVVSDTLTPQEAVEQAVDVQSLADAYIISELTCDADLYWSSFFMSADFGENGDKRLTFQAPWDFDSAMGNKDRCADGTGFYAANIIPDVNGNEYKTVNPWLAVLMYQDWFQDIIRDTWSRAYDDGVFQRGIDMIARDRETYADAFSRNEKKWGNPAANYSVSGELCPGAKACKTQKDAADYLGNWLQARVDFMNGYWHK